MNERERALRHRLVAAHLAALGEHDDAAHQNDVVEAARAAAVFHAVGALEHGVCTNHHLERGLVEALAPHELEHLFMPSDGRRGNQQPAWALLQAASDDSLSKLLDRRSCDDAVEHALERTTRDAEEALLARRSSAVVRAQLDCRDRVEPRGADLRRVGALERMDVVLAEKESAAGLFDRKAVAVLRHADQVSQDVKVLYSWYRRLDLIF
mmetsp:Transcript_32202/g.75010  ORF Transcript_32202/g.75010 Transcript_32202/m.75010 type:complete len:210 (+) Transcript_32202:1758-2387(+)